MSLDIWDPLVLHWAIRLYLVSLWNPFGTIPWLVDLRSLETISIFNLSKGYASGDLNWKISNQSNHRDFTKVPNATSTKPQSSTWSWGPKTASGILRSRHYRNGILLWVWDSVGLWDSTGRESNVYYKQKTRFQRTEVGYIQFFGERYGHWAWIPTWKQMGGVALELHVITIFT